MAKPIMFNVERMIAVVAAEHRFILKPDAAAFALVTMNRLVLEESLEAIRAVVIRISRNSRKPRSGLIAGLSRRSSQKFVD
jgi:hypothetical protein